MTRLVGLVLLGLAACNSGPPKDLPPLRVPITVTDEGYAPDRIEAERGQRLTLVFTRKTETECLEKVKFPALQIEKELPVNQPVEVTITAQKSGPIPFSCGMEMAVGTVVIK